MDEPVTNVEFWIVLQMLAQDKIAKPNQEGVVPNVGTTPTRVWDFMIMNPAEFYGSKGFIDEVYTLVAIMGYLQKSLRLPIQRYCVSVV